MLLSNGLAASEDRKPTNLKQSNSSKNAAATTQTRPASQRIDPLQFDPDLVARLVFEKTNDERRKAGLKPFAWMDGLAAAAAGHSVEMAGHNYFSHTGKGVFKRSNVSSRADNAGVQARALAENIAMLPTFRSQQTRTFIDAHGKRSQRVEQEGNSYEELAVWAMDQWMNSPGHRQNILNPALTQLGVGVALGDNKGVPYVYLTQDFAGE
ncbi:MAG: CAP domain-containing protein [Candidatus Sumerlaeaceae bacterium]